MTKVVYNRCYGGFSLSDEAIEMYLNLKGLSYTKTGGGILTVYNVPLWQDRYFSSRSISRDDPDLIRVVETLGAGANGLCASLEIEDLPAGTLYRITEYDGYESIETRDTTDWKVA